MTSPRREPPETLRDQSPAITGVTYVPAEVVAAIETAQDGSKWDCRKLLELIRELNDNYTAENGNCVNALLRVIVLAANDTNGSCFLTPSFR